MCSARRHRAWADRVLVIGERLARSARAAPAAFRTVTRSITKRELLVASNALIHGTSHKAVAVTEQTRFHFQIECSPTSAILYIGGDACSTRLIGALSAIVDGLPRSTRVLRVDLHGVVSMSLQTLMDLRAMMARWRTERSANVRMVLRSPLPREEWPTSAIQFERAPLRLVETSRTAELVTTVLHRGRNTLHARPGIARPESALRLLASSAGAL